MKDLIIDIVQADLVWENKLLNKEKFESFFNQVSEDSDIVVLPEMFSTGFSMSPERFAETMEGETINWLKNWSVKLNKALTGSLIIEEGGNYFNRLVWVTPNGDVSFYDKKHCFRYAGEHEHYTPGNKELIVDFKGWKIACFICYDLRFPVWSRNIGLKYDVALYIANWPERRAEHWKALLKARAIENQAYVLGINRVGEDGNGISHSGDSNLISPLGDLQSDIQPNLEVIERVVLSKEVLEDYRSKFPAHMDGDEFKFI